MEWSLLAKGGNILTSSQDRTSLQRRRSRILSPRVGSFTSCVKPWLQIKSAVLLYRQEAKLSPSDRAMRLVSSNLANYHARVQKLLIRQVLAKPIV